MPGKIRLKIIAARNLPVMDRSSDSTDAFVEVRFGEDLYEKTEVYKKSLDPQWNARFNFEVEEDEIQEEPLVLRILDHDTYTSHDAIGKVYIDLKPLLTKNGPSSINGWFPIFDTMHGIRGEIHIEVKLELLSDKNTYKKSSTGVQFFSSSQVPEGFVLQNICGFVEELVINDDPEYKLIDKIRAPRTSNEARQKLFSQLSGELQRRIGLKVLDLNANCVLGYIQYFDLEGEHGVVVRGIGTAAVIFKHSYSSPNNLLNTSNSPHILQHTVSVVTPPSQQSSIGNDLFNGGGNIKLKKQSPNRFGQIANQSHPTANNNCTNNNILLQRVHSDPNFSITTTTTQNQLTVYPILAPTPAVNLHQTQMNWEKNSTQAPVASTKSQQTSILDKMEYPFLTLQQYPIGFIKSLCGVVCARSVKLHTNTTNSSLNEIDLRDKWWTEIRNEIRSQMKSFNCHIVLGYTETKAICDDLVVLSAMGTAALVDEKYFNILNSNQQQQQLQSQQNTHYQQLCVNTNLLENLYNYDFLSNFNDSKNKTCSLCHLIPSVASSILNQQVNLTPDTITNNSNSNNIGSTTQQQSEYDEQSVNQQNSTIICAQCSQAQVPNVLFLTIQPIPELLTIGKGCFIKALVTRSYKKSSGETTARIISDCLPFIEYELHRQLLNKLKLNGMNTLYGLKSQISIGENSIIGIAEATACFTACLPQPNLIKLVGNKTNSEIEEINKQLKENLLSNVDFFRINSEIIKKELSNFESNILMRGISTSPVTNGQLNDNILIEQQQYDHSNYIKIDLDDAYERENLDLLLSKTLKNKEGFYSCNTQYMPGLTTNLKSNLQMFFRVYRCETSLGQLHTKEFNNIIEKILLSLRYKFRYYKNCCLTNLAFDISLYDDDHAMIIVTGSCLNYDLKNSNFLTSQTENDELKQKNTRNRCELTTLNYVPNKTIDRYLGYINLFLIRESTSIKEGGGLNGFMNYFINEMLSLTRAHVLSLGGDALVSFKLNECFLIDNPHKNLGQCLINIAGDVVMISS